MVCQGVSVPPQSKMTASTGTRRQLAASGDRHDASAIRSAASATGTSTRSPVRRSRTSTTPSASPLPTTTIVGTPISSASLNFTPGRDPAPVVEEDLAAPASRARRRGVSAAAKTASSLPVATRCTSAGATARGQHRPSSSCVGSAIAATARDDADAVRAHRDHDLLAVLVEHLEVERVGELAAELEDVADLDAAGDLEGAAAPFGHGSPVAHLGGLDRAVAGEVAAGDQVEDVPARLVGAGDPAGALDDARVEQVAHACDGSSAPSAAGPM